MPVVFYLCWILCCSLGFSLWQNELLSASLRAYNMLEVLKQFQLDFKKLEINGPEVKTCFENQLFPEWQPHQWRFWNSYGWNYPKWFGTAGNVVWFQTAGDGKFGQWTKWNTRSNWSKYKRKSPDGLHGIFSPRFRKRRRTLFGLLGV